MPPTLREAVVKRAPDRAWLTMATETREARAAGKLALFDAVAGDVSHHAPIVAAWAARL